MLDPAIKTIYQASRTKSAYSLVSCLLLFTLARLTQPNAHGQGQGSRQTQDRSIESELRVGTPSDNYPYSFLDEKGTVTGFACDLLDAVARQMDLKIKRFAVPGLDLSEHFQRGEYDILQLSPSMPEQASYADFSVPYLILDGALFVRKEDTRFKTMADIRDKHARIATGRAGFYYATRLGVAASSILVLPPETGIKSVSAGEYDAALVARLSGDSLIHRLGIKNLTTTGPLIDEFPIRYCFAVPYGRSKVLAQLNEGLAILHQTGEYDTIYRKWFGRYEPKQITHEELVGYTAAVLAIALAVTLWGLFRQRQLRRRIARQAQEIAESKFILAEAQSFARLGNWQGLLDKNGASIWSDETYRIFERDIALGPPTVEELIQYAIAPDRKEWEKALARASSDGSPYELDLRIEPKPGIRKTIHARGRAVYDAAGNISSLFGTMQDVTEWREAEHALRQSEQLLRALYNNIPYAMGVAEFDGSSCLLVSVNPEAVRLFGLSTANIAGQNLHDLGLASEWDFYWTELFARCHESGSVLKTELSRTDQKRDFAITVVPLGTIATGRPRFCFLAEDITSRKQKDSEISQGRRLRAIGELVGGIAHEFNNLLTPILLKADQLQVDWHHEAELQNDLKLITTAARRSADLTRRLLTFGRKTDSYPETLSLTTVVDSNVELLRHTIDRRIHIECNVPNTLPALYLNGGDLHQIIVNILLNARDTLVEKLQAQTDRTWEPQIAIEASDLNASKMEALESSKDYAPKSWIRLTFRDNGMGMSSDVQERIFEPFYTTKQVGKGTGLGLATAWHLIADMGGRIEVESTLGEGSSFHLYLPVRNPKVALVSNPAKPSAGTASAKDIHILLVEDEDMIARLIVAIVKRQGHKISHYLNGREAWEKLSATPSVFTTLILDLNMPGLTGLELLRLARQQGYEHTTLITSGRVTDDERRELVQLHVAGIVQKPFTYEMFTTALASVGIQPNELAESANTAGDL